MINEWRVGEHAGICRLISGRRARGYGKVCGNISVLVVHEPGVPP